ncbi:MAG: GTPase, partial [Candidatus Shapirobacteria bacterium]
DLIIEIPVGTVAHYDNGTEVEFTQVGQTFLAAKGGKGGRGNHFFRSSINQQPQEAEEGFKTEPKRIRLELKLIAQVGLVGLPNAGKSSLLNELTSAHSKVASYPFTTLEPNLGVLPGGYIMADIPGIIEGASTGKGLGHKFLRHLERTSILVHCIAADSTNPKKDIAVINQELAAHSTVLSQKPQILVITKSDLLTPAEVKKLTASLKADLAVSIIDELSLKLLTSLLSQRLGAEASTDSFPVRL